MWISKYLTKNSLSVPKATKGEVNNFTENRISVSAGSEFKNLKLAVPYGYFYCMPKGSEAVVLPLTESCVGLGVIMEQNGLDQGEIMIRSSGGASIVLKNDGRVLINGKAV